MGHQVLTEAARESNYKGECIITRPGDSPCLGKSLNHLTSLSQLYRPHQDNTHS